MPSFDTSTREGAMEFLVVMRLEPYWKPEGSPSVLFRKIRNMKGLYRVTRQGKEQIWPELIDSLKMKTQEDVKRVRQEVRNRLR